ncbi:MAG TPA: hypothetical protein DCQ98_02540 [Planctomycetaceae bacterium]|nr:hypothetical protein [Planctomycetaceae bacterium]
MRRAVGSTSFRVRRQFGVCRVNARSDDRDEFPEVELREPAWAALLAWLIPGAGHLYQRRFAKAAIFFVTIMSIYVSGVAIGGGQVVYASWRPNDYHWQFACQAGVGLPAFPAVIQYFRARDGKMPFFADRAYRINGRGEVLEEVSVGTPGSIATGPFSPPPGPIPTDQRCVLSIWHERLQHRFEIGTLYTVVAGLLNLLAVYDAFAGPFFIVPEGKDDEDDDERKDDDS